MKRENETKQIQDIIVYLLAYNFLFMVFNGCSRVALLLVDAHLNFKAINKLLTAWQANPQIMHASCRFVVSTPPGGPAVYTRTRSTSHLPIVTKKLGDWLGRTNTAVKRLCFRQCYILRDNNPSLTIRFYCCDNQYYEVGTRTLSSFFCDLPYVHSSAHGLVHKQIYTWVVIKNLKINKYKTMLYLIFVEKRWKLRHGNMHSVIYKQQQWLKL